MRIHIRTGTGRAKPHVGDVKIVKGVRHVRELEYVHDRNGNRLGINKTGGRYHYVWVPCPAAPSA
jgi:hypothetical protein